MGQIEKSMNTIPLPLKCLAMLILEFDLGASASEGELPGRVTGSPRADNCLRKLILQLCHPTTT